MKGSTVIWEKSTTPVVTPDYFYVENTYAGTNTLTLTTTITNSPSASNYSTSVQYSKDKINWTTINFDTTSPYNITMNEGEKVYFRNDSGKFNYHDGNSNDYHTSITCSQTNNVGGNLNSLLDYTNIDSVTLPIGAFNGLFNGNSKLIDASNIVITHTTLVEFSHADIFRNCSSLTGVPDLSHITTLGYGSLSGSFAFCSSLVTPPDFLSLVNTGERSGLSWGFHDCTSLTRTPLFPNLTTVGYLGLNQCFVNCSNLTAGADLSSVTTLGTKGLERMYQNCSSLSSAVTPTLSSWDTNKSIQWLNGVASSGILYNNCSVTIPIGVNGIPRGWTEVKPSQVEYFYVENLDDGTNSISGENNLKLTTSVNSGTLTKTIEYSKDKISWITLNLSSTTPTTIAMNVGDKIYFRNTSGTWNTINSYTKFTCTYNFSVGGDITSLLDYRVDNLQTLPNYCFRELFSPNTHLINSHNLILPSITSDYCFRSMFSGCSSLTTTPALPATTLASHCYESMFQGCTSLTTAPALPATTLASHCYLSMFVNCHSLTSVDVTATTLAENSCQLMFSGCTGLKNATLRATTIVINSCIDMFINCSSLNSITTYTSDVSATNCLQNWTSGVAATGTFYNNGSASYVKNSASGIPSGWTEVKPIDYFYLENVDSQSGNVSFKFTGKPSSSTIQQIEWSKDKTNWTPVTLVADTTTNVPVNANEKVYFRNDSGKLSSSMYIYLSFGGDVPHNTGGDVNTLLDYTTDTTTLSTNYIFARLFYNDTNLRNTSNLTLGYTTLGNYCYKGMFSGCTSLTTTPALPATTIANNCYQGMFSYCTSLTTAPALPATTLGSYSYSEMFTNCVSLTTTPALPATTLPSGCYKMMFSECTSLDSVTIYANDISASSCLTDWLYNVAATGTFYNLGSATYPTDSTSGIPTGWEEVTEL